MLVCIICNYVFMYLHIHVFNYSIYANMYECIHVVSTSMIIGRLVIVVNFTASLLHSNAQITILCMCAQTNSSYHK